MSAPRKINAILLNIKINWPNICGYKLAIYSKISWKYT